MALWKARSLTPEQKVQLVEEESETEDFQNEEGESFLGIEDAQMSGVFSSTKPFDVRFLILLKQCAIHHVLHKRIKKLQLYIVINFMSLGINTHGHI